MASSSASSVTKTFKYDVFLSFRGETRLNFVDHLNVALQQRNIYTYKDDEKMKKGTMINEDLIKSIEDSRFYIIVFSKDYGYSSWCLDELVKIMECHKETGHTAYPVFYDVKPSEVRDQEGAFGEAFAKLKEEKAIESDEKGVFEKWREALKEAADLAGWELKKTADGHEAIFIQKIVEMISLELRSTLFSIDENLVGMESRIEGVLSYLGTGCDDVRMIGIWGMGGGGKTTLARAVFDRISLHFEGKSFVENVREVSNTLPSGLSSLQTQVLIDVLNDQGMRVSGVSDGKHMLRRRMGGRKVLLVLDDVDRMEQLEALAGDPKWFKPGSIIIITTRDEQVLIAHKVKLIHNVNLLSDEEAILLFSRYASRGEIPIQEYEELSQKVVVYAAGLPLTIKVLGSFLCGKSNLEWADALERLKKIPLEETLKKLELSYIGLEAEYKEIFLDVACILKGWSKDRAIQALESCGFHARIGLRVLEQKSLITTTDEYGYERVGMHDHIEEMGRNIVRRLHPDKPNKHSRLWIREEIKDTLINDLGTKATKCMVFSRSLINPSQSKLDVGIIKKGLRKMKDLRFLYISWDGASPKQDDISPTLPTALRYMHFEPYPFGFLPKTFEANNLVTLQMPNSDIVELWEGGDEKVLNKLRFLDLSNSKLRILNLGLTPNIETLTLHKCYYLEKLHMPAACLRLKSVYLTRSKIRTFHLGLAPNLDELILKKLRSLNLFGSTLGALDLGLTPYLETLQLGELDGLEKLHMPIEWPKLRFLGLIGLTLRTLELGFTPNIEGLNLRGDLEELHMPTECPKLRFLALNGLKLRTLDLGLTPNIEELYLGGDLEELRMPVECLKLKIFEICGSKLRTLDLRPTPNLERLSLKKCYDLVELHLPGGCLKLKHLTCIGSNVRTLDLELAPILESLELTNLDNWVDLHLPRRCLNLRYLLICKSQLRTLDMGLTPNLKSLELTNCYYLEELHLADGCQKLKRLRISHSKLSIIDLGSVPNLKELSLCECNDLLELRMPITCLNLKTVELLANSKLRTLDLGLTPNLKKLNLRDCYNLEELHMPVECLKLRFLNLFGLKLRTLDLGLTPNLMKLNLRDCYNLEELHMPVECLKLRSLKLFRPKLKTLDLGLAPNIEELDIRCDLEELCMPVECLKIFKLCGSKLRTLDLTLTPNLEKLYLERCYDLVELYMPNRCLKLKHLSFEESHLRTLDLRLTPNLETLYLIKCFDLVELHLPDGCLKLEHLTCIDSNVRTLDLELAPILKLLTLARCDILVDLHLPRSCLNLEFLTLSKSKLRTLDMGLTPNLNSLELTNCYYLEEVHLDGCQKLERLTIHPSKLSIIDLGSVPNLKELSLHECNDLLELRMPSTCLNLETVVLRANPKLRTLDLGLTPNLKKLNLRNCYNLEELHMADECQNLTYLEISHSKLRTLNVGLAPNLKKLYLCECDDLVEFHIVSTCLNLKVVFLTNSKLKTFDLGLTPNLKNLVLGNCFYLEELHMASECPKLESIEIYYSNLRTLDLSLTPNLKKLDLKGCYMLVELHVPIGGLKSLVYLDLSGCLRFKSFLFQIKEDTKDDTDESFQFGPLAELSFILEKCPIHPENNFPKFQFTCLHKEDLPSLTRNLEKLISGGFCACENLKRFSRNIFGLRR